MLENCKVESIKQSTQYIRISEVRAVGSKLVSRLDLSENIKKYFLKDSFVVEYDKNIEHVDESILAVPPLFIVAPVAWAIGADVYLDRLDQTSLQSLQGVRKVFQEWYPKFSSAGRIYVNNLVNNKFSNKQSALLFSGGLDSTVSYVRHKDEHPTLITFLRGETYPYEDAYYNTVKNAFLDFAKNEGVNIHFIRTDLWDMHSNVLNNKLLTRDSGVVDWWIKVSHGLMLLGLAAPLTVENIRTLYMASTFARNYKPHTGNGSHVLSYTDVSWADIRVIYDGSEFTRQEKIKQVLKPNQDYCKNLRTCAPITNPGYYKNKNSYSHSYVKNCGICEKCVETTMGLLLENIDPIRCNLDTNNNVLDYVKHLFNIRVLKLAGDEDEFFADIQRHTPNTISDAGMNQSYNAKRFFEWFQHFDISSYRGYSSDKLRMLLWAYCLMKYRGINYTISLMIRSVRKNPILHL